MTKPLLFHCGTVIKKGKFYADDNLSAAMLSETGLFFKNNQLKARNFSYLSCKKDKRFFNKILPNCNFYFAFVSLYVVYLLP